MQTIFEWAIGIPVFLMAARFWYGAIRWCAGNKPAWEKAMASFTSKE